MSDETKREENKRVVGKITKLSDKGWGFINTHEIQFTRIFFHWSALRQSTLNFTELKTGMQVEFNPEYTERDEARGHEGGYRAKDISVVVDDIPREV